jgi:outer membrane lipase/esterase
MLANAMNIALVATLDPIADVRIFDVAGLIAQAIAAPLDFGMANVSDACAANLATCDPSSWLFWDGIHPTSGGHAMLAQAMVSLVPEPGSLALIALALGPALLITRRRLQRQ